MHDNLSKLQALGIRVKAHRGDIKTQCPWCSDTRKNKREPCLSVNVEKGVYLCHHCGKSGAVMEDEIQYTVPTSTLTKVSDKIVNWFAGRGISNNTLLRYGITESIEYMPQVGDKRMCINFNYFLNGKLVNIKYRDGEKNFKLVSGARLLPYGIDVCLDSSDTDIAIVEGEMDVLALYEAGIAWAISVPNGASKGNQKLEWLDEFMYLFENRTVTIATDSDGPGVELRNELARRIGKENCKVVDWAEYKDANGVLMGPGANALRDFIASARMFPLEGIDDAHTSIQELYELYDKGTPETFELGYDMDEDFKLSLGQVVLVTGIPGHGKSSFIKNILWRTAQRHGWKHFIYSGEEASTAMALTDIYSIATGKPFFQTPGHDRLSREEIDAMSGFMGDHFKYYRLLDNDMSVEGILAKGREMVRRFGIHTMVIDNMSTVEKSMPKSSDTRHNMIGEMMQDVTRFARNHGVLVILVAHPKKMQKNGKGRYEVPNGYDVGDSSHWFNAPDVGVSVYRNLDTGLSELHRWKVRFRYNGSTGASYFKYNIANGIFTSTENVNDGKSKDHFIGERFISGAGAS